jgi:hypothetical protein
VSGTKSIFLRFDFNYEILISSFTFFFVKIHKLHSCEGESSTMRSDDRYLVVSLPLPSFVSMCSFGRAESTYKIWRHFIGSKSWSHREYAAVYLRTGKNTSSFYISVYFCGVIPFVRTMVELGPCVRHLAMNPIDGSHDHWYSFFNERMKWYQSKRFLSRYKHLTSTASKCAFWSFWI